MKNLSFLLFALVMGALSLTACKNEGKDKSSEAATEQTTTNPQPAATPQPNVQMPADFTPVSGPPPSPAQNAKGVWHFTCEKGCPGGAGAAGSCAKCGSPLVHNQAYHAN